MIMKMTNTKYIDLSREIAEIISSRDVILNLQSIVNSLKEDSVVLNFANVDFISRSAAHQFLLLQESMDRKNIQFENLNESVAQMFAVVSQSRKNIHTKRNLQPQRMTQRGDVSLLYT